MTHNDSGNPSAEEATETVANSPPRQFDSAELLHGDKEVLIHHGGEVYRLRLTKNGKLILQK